MPKIRDLENGPSWTEDRQAISKSIAPNREVELDGLTGLFLADGQGAHDMDQHMHQQIHIAGSPNDRRRRKIKRRTSEEIQAKERHKALKSSKLSDLEFHDRLTAAGINAVYYRSPPEQPLSYNIALNSLQRMVLHELQSKLVGVVRKIVQKQGVEEDLMENARELLGKYSMCLDYQSSFDSFSCPNKIRLAAANRDYDYMTEKLAQTADNAEKDPFLITTNDILGFCLMRDHQLIPTGDQLKEPEQVMHGKRPVVLPGSSRNEHEEKIQWARLWERIFMGVCGGVALIAPMLLMVLHKTQATTLATTSVATILFALMLALLGKDLRGQDVLAAVAAYAAVLVVFVGASST
ncbi:hypothetical protein N7528_003359 [Penicillium herquei]|nr:hypothetical protein N7528_003359 [Penicillium herquei]